MSNDWRIPTVYIMVSGRNGTLYVGVTSDLQGRVEQHKQGTHAGFTSRYKVHMLVYYEQHVTMTDAIYRETQLKRWKGEWKLRLGTGTKHNLRHQPVFLPAQE